LPILEQCVLGGAAVNGAGIVDEDIEATEMLFDLIEEIFGARDLCKIRLKGHGVRAYSFSGGGSRSAIPVDGYLGAGLRECDGDGCAQTAGGACYERHLTVQAKVVKNAG